MDELANITIENNEAEQTPVAPADKTPEATAGKTPKDRAFKPLVLVPEKAKLLYTHDYGTQVFVARCSDRKKITHYFYVVSIDGEVSEPVAKPLTKLTGKKGFDFLMDMEGDFDKQDTDTIRNNFNNIVKDIPIIEADTKTPMAAIYKGFCNQVKELAKEADDDPKSGGAYGDRVLDIVEGCTYGNILTDIFNDFVKEMVDSEEWGKWTGTSIKQELKRLGKLRYNKGRNDYFIADVGRTISIKLPEGWCYTE